MNPDIQKAFHEAVKKNDVETVRRMIAAGADVNAAYDEYENRSLLDASYQGNLDLVKMLVEAGADVNLSDGSGVVPLVRAIVSWHETDEVVKYLIECGANVNACEGESWTPLEAAVHENASDIVKILLKAGANPQISSEKGEYSLVTAADWGYVDIVKMLLDAGANPNVSRSENCTPLIAACRWGHDEAAVLLLQAGANPNVIDSDFGDSLLMQAAEDGNPKCVKLILGLGVDVNHRNYEGETALSYAVNRRLPYIVRELLRAGANPNTKNNAGTSPLSFALTHKNYACAEILLRFRALLESTNEYYSADILENIDDLTIFYNLKDNGIPFRSDDEAVVLYAKHACSYLLRKALEAGANPNATDNTGKSALAWALEHPRHPQGCTVRLIRHGAKFNNKLIIYAVRNRMRELLHTLIEAGADVNVTDERGNSALHYAVRSNRGYLIRDLIEAGANIESKNGNNLTPLMLAIQHRCYTSAGSLLEHNADMSATGGMNNETAREMCIRYHCKIENNKLIKKEWTAESSKILTPYRFYWAAQSGDTSKIQSLIAQGLDINAQNEDGMTALHLGYCEEGVIARLIQTGADMYIETYADDYEQPYTAAMLAADSEDRENLKKFLDYGYNVNHQTSIGTTLLMFCAGRYWPRGVQLLLEYGADPSIKDKDGRTALFYTTCWNVVCYDEIIDYLIENGANINEVDNEGNTALLQIAHEEIEGDGTHLDLIGRGIDVNIRNNAGETALSIARKHGHSYLISELLAAGAIDN